MPTHPDRYVATSTSTRSAPGWGTILLVIAVTSAAWWAWGTTQRDSPAEAKPAEPVEALAEPPAPVQFTGSLEQQLQAAKDQVADLMVRNDHLQTLFDEADGRAEKNRQGLNNCVAELNRVASSQTRTYAPPPPSSRSRSATSEPTEYGRIHEHEHRTSIQVLGDKAYARGKVFSSATTTLDATLVVDLIDGGQVIDSGVVDLTVPSRGTEEWEVEFFVGEGIARSLSVRTRLEQ